MNNHCIFWMALMVGLWSSTSGSANDLVARPRAGMQWTVEIYSPDSRKAETTAGKTENELSTEAYQKEENVTGRNLRRETKVMNDGNTLIRYASEGLVLYVDPRTGEPAVEGSSNEGTYGGPLRADAFGEFAWVEKQWHQGEQTFAGTLCDVFVAPWPAESAYDSSEDLPLNPADEQKSNTKATPPVVLNTMKSVQTAFIDKKTRLPVLLESPAEVRRYLFSPEPASLELPRELSETLEKRKAAILWRRQRFDIPQ